MHTLNEKKKKKKKNAKQVNILKINVHEFRHVMHFYYNSILKHHYERSKHLTGHHRKNVNKRTLKL